MNNLTRSQIFQIALCLLGVLIAGTGQLTVLFGPLVTSYIVSAAGLAVAGVSGVGAIVTGQGNQALAVQAMPGVERLLLNKNANATLATLAADPANTKILATPDAKAAVAATAAAAA